MNLAELIAAVQTVELDGTFDPDEIEDVLNRGMLEVAAGGDRGHGLPKLAPLPLLSASGTVSITDGSGAMPADFHRGLQLVMDASGNEIRQNDSFKQLLRKYGTSTGAAEEYCLVGNTLHVRPILAETLTVYYHSLPDTLTESNDIPDGLPAHLHHKVLVNFAAKELFSLIEQDMNGRTPNFDKHNALYQAALTDLEREIGAEDLDPQYVEDDGDYQ